MREVLLILLSCLIRESNSRTITVSWQDYSPVVTPSEVQGWSDELLRVNAFFTDEMHFICPSVVDRPHHIIRVSSDEELGVNECKFASLHTRLVVGTCTKAGDVVKHRLRKQVSAHQNEVRSNHPYLFFFEPTNVTDGYSFGLCSKPTMNFVLEVFDLPPTTTPTVDTSVGRMKLHPRARHHHKQNGERREGDDIRNDVFPIFTPQHLYALDQPRQVGLVRDEGAMKEGDMRLVQQFTEGYLIGDDYIVSENAIDHSSRLFTVLPYLLILNRLLGVL